MKNKLKNKYGFTMIELIIVTSIIGILAAIAIPNFLAARTRAKVSRVKAEQEMLMIALQSYFADKTTYPPNHKSGLPSDIDLIALTTPIAYMTSLPKDLFQYPELREVKAAQQYLKIEKGKLSDIRFRPVCFWGFRRQQFCEIACRERNNRVPCVPVIDPNYMEELCKGI